VEYLLTTFSRCDLHFYVILLKTTGVGALLRYIETSTLDIYVL